MKRQLVAPFAVLAISLVLAACGPTTTSAGGSTASSASTSAKAIAPASPSIAAATTDPANPPGNSDGNQPPATSPAPVTTTPAPAGGSPDDLFRSAGFILSSTLPDTPACAILGSSYMTSLVGNGGTHFLTTPQTPNLSYCSWYKETQVSGKPQVSRLVGVTIACGQSAMAIEKKKEGVSDWAATRSRASNAKLSYGGTYAGGNVNTTMGSGAAQDCWLMTAWVNYATLSQPGAPTFALKMLNAAAANIG